MSKLVEMQVLFGLGINLDRKNQLAKNLEEIEARILKSCQEAGRDRKEIMLIAVTKNFPASDVDILFELGIQNVGENRDQEASVKNSQVKNRLLWHFIGQLQTNKVKSVVKYCEYIH